MSNDNRERIIVKKTFEGEEFDVIYMKGTPGKTKEEMDAMRASGNVNVDPAAATFSYCPALNTCTYQAGPGIICHRDTPVKMRDGVTIYADIYVPENLTEKVPCIVSWGIFGKRPAEGQDEWKLMGVPPKTVSNMAKFESADPGYWCRNGYAVANVDARGVGNSEGYCNLWGTEDAQDGYDFIEWAAQQDWCNGKCTLFGNSGVCMANWKIASLQPPHLACLAAWEGTSDLYRESYFCGGIPNPAYEENIIKEVACKTYVEDTVSMVNKYPEMNAYWRDKQVKFKEVRVPTYVTAGWVHHHLRGSVEGFRRIRAPKKWLRIHRDFEWPDAYNPDNLEELKRFFDRYCKDINNGWEFTPKVRVDVLDAYDFDYAVRRKEKEWPLARTEYKKLYLNAEAMDGGFDTYANPSEVVYDPNTETTEFLIPVNEDIEITGYMKLHLEVECRGYDNMDIFPWVLKYNANKEYVPIEVMGAPYRGAWGFCRASHRDMDPTAKDFQPIQSHLYNERLEPGKIYPLDIEMYPHSRIWHKGEYIVVRLAGKFIKTEWFHDAAMNHNVDNGDGMHVIHTGGEHQSYLQVPAIPPKYVSGDYVYRG
ncbi:MULTISPECIES: CocE/NonD family hydrolase [Agathobacter]|uniref:Acyl esterase n=2 Tax=Agathobacter ruminis TaxID=1712665 RepID=A0A2G3E030_9FIRM|nr:MULTISPECIES: CocE/NonD family hydrolase [Agathobacter]MBQ1681281.1 CocE/NonD family hydrolase [Agathobacter sp.]MDC7300679.1 CocE/NonD family hydrolase [Agathobacter ruminis]PHU36483.1 acyl esterase [Agathobacter ruminis]